MQTSDYKYVYRTESTGSCYATTPETADPSAVASRLRGYSYTVRYVARSAEEPSDGASLVSKMVADRAFVQRVEAGLVDLDNGRVSSVEEVMRRHGDL
jgi:hypothetical protein